MKRLVIEPGFGRRGWEVGQPLGGAALARGWGGGFDAFGGTEFLEIVLETGG
jgi:hypothetical protein